MILLKILEILLNIPLMLLVIVPTLLVTVIPQLLYRWFISISAKIVRRDFVSLVGVRDSVLANDKVLLNPSSTIVLYMFVDGDLDLETIREKATSHLFEGSFSQNPQKKYAVLTQYFVNWGGYVFRKWEENFDIKNHVKEWAKVGGDVVTREDLYLLRRKLMVEPYKAKTSLWEIFLVKNYQESEGKPIGSFMICRVHHGVVDGYSTIIAFLRTWCNITDMGSIMPVPHLLTRPLTLVQNAAIFTKLFAEAPTTALNQIPSIDPANIFHPHHTETASRLTGKRHPTSAIILLKTVKDAAHQSGTSYTAVIMAGLTGGIRNYLSSRKKNVPKTIDVVIPLPWPGHDSDKLRNYFTFALIEIPTGLTDHLHRLKKIQKRFLELKTSSVPALNIVLSNIAGILPNPLKTLLMKTTPCSILFSSLPGPNRQIEFMGVPLILPPMFEGGNTTAKLGMGFTTASYDKYVGININPEEGVVATKKDAEDLIQSIVDEIQLIHDSTLV